MEKTIIITATVRLFKMLDAFQKKYGFDIKDIKSVKQVEILKEFFFKPEYYDYEILNYLTGTFGICLFVADFALRVWLYQNFAKNGLRQIARELAKSEYFTYPKLSDPAEFRQLLKDSIRLNGLYYEDSISGLCGDYDQDQVMTILASLIDTSKLTGQISDYQQETKLIDLLTSKE